MDRLSHAVGCKFAWRVEFYGVAPPVARELTKTLDRGLGGGTRNDGLDFVLQIFERCGVCIPQSTASTAPS
jgi:hypothetical protein